MPNIVLKQHRGSLEKVRAFAEDLVCQSAHVDDWRGWPWLGQGYQGSSYVWMPKAWTLYVDGRPVAVGCVYQVRTFWGRGPDPLNHPPMYRAAFCTIEEYTRQDGFTRRRLAWKASDLFDWPAKGDKWLKATLTQLAEATA